MAEQRKYAILHCEPCDACVREERQFLEDGLLRWEAYEYCPRYAVQSCDRGRGVPPPWVRERVVAREGTVHLPVGGSDGVPLALLRRMYGLTVAQVVAARTAGRRATPVEARLLAEPAAPTAAGPAEPG